LHQKRTNTYLVFAAFQLIPIFLEQMLAFADQRFLNSKPQLMKKIYNASYAVLCSLDKHLQIFFFPQHRFHQGCIMNAQLVYVPATQVKNRVG
jgi:hypothetical protein